MFSVNLKNVELDRGSSDHEKLKGKISVALGTLQPLLGDIPDNIIDGGNYTIEDPIFYVEDETLKIRKRGDNTIAWREIENNGPLMAQLDPIFLKKLYIISKVRSIIDDFGGGISPEQAVGFAFFDLEAELGNIDESIWSNRTTTINEFKDMLKENLKHVKKQTQITNVWDGINPSFDTSAFILTKVNHETEIPNLSGKNELMVFDSIKLNDLVVACFYQDLIKYNPENTDIINDYLNQDRMLTKKIKASDIVRIMITSNLPNARLKYKMINIFVTKDNKITLTIESLINEPKVNDSLKNIIKNILIDMEEQEAYNQRVEKDFFYGTYTASINIPIIVLKDLVTNDPNVYNISYINESALITTRRNTLNLYLKEGERSEDWSERSRDIGVSIFERPETVGMFIRLKKIKGGSDLKTRIDSNIATVNKILAYTFSKVDLIIDFYKKYVDLKVELQPFNKSLDSKALEQAHRAKVPEIFAPNYTRLCGKPPIVVEDEALNQSLTGGLSDDHEIIKFPIYGEIESKLFKCPYPGYKYPGLRENTKLINKEIFPFLPCCYQRPQKNSKNYKAYFNQEIYKQRINMGEVGKTLKILSPKRLGVLPPKIDKLLNYSTKDKFYRFGSPLSKTSCLDVLNMVTDQDNLNHVKIRSELAKRAELCKGGFSTLTVKEIEMKIMDPNTYINPRYFKGALEDYYQISYILFSKDKDDFSLYPNRFVRFICPLKKKVIFMIEHEESEHVELIVDEETLNYINKQGKKPIYLYDKSDLQIKQIFSIYMERFNYILYDIDNKGFKNLSQSTNKMVFQMYPWEYININGKISRYVEPLNQYVDGFGQTRLVEFKFENISFVGQFEPLPCLKIPIKNLDHFLSINGDLTPQQTDKLTREFPWCTLTPLTPFTSLEGQDFHKFTRLKKMAEYILWAACHVYSTLYLKNENLTVDEWITKHTRIVDDYTYSRVTIRPIFNISELMVDGKFIFSSMELQDRIRFNVSLISSANLSLFSTNIYHSFYKDISNFKVEYPAQLALSKRDYFERTREPYILNILNSKNIQYIRSNVLYFIKELFGYFNGVLCLFLPSINELVEAANKLLFSVVLGETLINVVVFDQNNVHQYSLGQKEPSIDVIIININGNWFYGLILPEFI